MLYTQAWRRRLLFAESKHVSFGRLVWDSGEVTVIAVEALMTHWCQKQLQIAETGLSDRSSTEAMIHCLQYFRLQNYFLQFHSYQHARNKCGAQDCARTALTAAGPPLCCSFWNSSAEEDFAETSEGILMTSSLWCARVNPIQILSTYKILRDLLMFSFFSSLFFLCLFFSFLLSF